jgi:hypothetical protein
LESPDAEPDCLRGAERAARWGLQGIEERLRSLADGEERSPSTCCR